MKHIIQNVYTCIEHIIVQDSNKKEVLIVRFYTYTQDKLFLFLFYCICDITFGSAFLQPLFLMLIIHVFAIFKKLDKILHTCVLNFE